MRSRLRGGVGAAALIAVSLAGAVAFATVPSSADTLFSPAQSAAARVPAQVAAIPGFTDLVTAVKPAVVSVRVKATSDGAEASDGAGPEDVNPFKGTPFERFFRTPPGSPGQGEGRRRGLGGQHTVRAQGSGFFVSADGYLVTNNHVVDHAVDVEIVTDDGKVLPAKVIGTDPRTDLALIKVDGRSDFPYVKLAPGKTQVGEWVVAMGNPFGLGGTVTAGIVSAQGRDLGSGPYDDYVQIDAPVNRGNSGGPTFNLKGEVIGVNTAIYSPSGGSVGIAFDVPASTVASVIPQLQARGHVTRGWLGVQIQAVTPEIADSLGLKAAQGVLIAEPQAGGPAEKAGLKAGDVLTTLDGIDLKDPRDLARRIAGLGPSTAVKLGIVRAGQSQIVQLTLGTLADNPKLAKAETGAPSNHEQIERLGLLVAPAAEIDGAGKSGVAVVEADPDGTAAEVGLKAGDVILKASGKFVSTPDDLRAALAEAKAAGRKSALVLFRRGQAESFVALPVAAG